MDDNLHSAHGRQELIHTVNQYTLSILTLSKGQARDTIVNLHPYLCVNIFIMFFFILPYVLTYISFVWYFSSFIIVFDRQIGQKLRDGLSNVERNHAYRICYNSSAKKIKLRSFSCDQVQLVLFRSRFHLKLLEKYL